MSLNQFGVARKATLIYRLKYQAYVQIFICERSVMSGRRYYHALIGICVSIRAYIPGPTFVGSSDDGLSFQIVCR